MSSWTVHKPIARKKDIRYSTTEAIIQAINAIGCLNLWGLESRFTYSEPQ